MANDVKFRPDRLHQRQRRGWTAPRPSVESVADVRKLSVCCVCKALGSDLLYVDRAQGAPLARFRRDRGRTAHAYCWATANDGLEVLNGLHVEELDKFTLSDLSGLDMHMSDLDVIVAEATRRTRKAVHHGGV